MFPRLELANLCKNRFNGLRVRYLKSKITKFTWKVREIIICMTGHLRSGAGFFIHKVACFGRWISHTSFRFTQHKQTILMKQGAFLPHQTISYSFTSPMRYCSTARHVLNECCNVNWREKNHFWKLISQAYHSQRNSLDRRNGMSHSKLGRYKK